jgi:hypothetical protein
MEFPIDKPFGLNALEVQENFFNITGIGVHLANGMQSPIFKGKQLGQDMSKIYPVKSDSFVALIIQKSKNANLSSVELLGRNYESLC